MVGMGLVVALTVVVTVWEREQERQQRATASREPCLALFFAYKTKMVLIFLLLIPTTQHYYDIVL